MTKVINTNQKGWQQKYGKLAVVTIAAIYLLILVGGIVRSSGSGMGCPDWPTCFGSWVPPTSAEQLPADYKEVYSNKRDQKNRRFAGMLDLLGAKELADKIRNDESILQEADFNPVKTWIEYINRLVGVAIGLLIMATVVMSSSFRKVKPGIFLASLGAFVLVVFQGWLGSIVVSTNLLPWMVTVHMLPALLIVALLIWAANRAVDQKNETHFFPVKVQNQLKVLVWVLIGLSLFQIVLGTQVREAVDEVAVISGYRNRENWIGELGLSFYVHRSFSILVVATHLFLFYLVRKFAQPGSVIYSWTLVLMATVLFEIFSGIVMAYFAIPALMQPMHLLFGTVLFGIQFYLLLLVSDRKVQKEKDYKSKACLL